ncbi:MAG: HD-GYP domain-containing protein [Desulfobacteraceae bacterium]|nr:HD-GYP domain-containing protein [Desulfobacteraceae bacterium]
MTDVYYKFFKIFTEVSKAIHSGNNIREIIETIVANVTDFTNAKGTIFWIINKPAKKIQTYIPYGFEYRSLSRVDYETLIQIFDSEQKKNIFIEDARYDDRIPDMERFGKKRVGSVTGMNFKITSQYSGVLAIYFTQYKKLNSQEIELVRALGEQGAIALHRALSYDGEMLKILRQMVEGLVLTLETRDETTHGHSMRVAQFARAVATELGLESKEVETIFHAGLLHDIGKIGLEDYILDRLGTLSKKEMNVAKKHPEIGARIVKHLTFLQGLEPIIKYHHERYNGSGYPERLKGEDIPLGARIVGVCDVFETMLSGRKHIQKLKLNDAVTQLIEKVNIQFDPNVVEALFIAIRKNPEIIDSSDSIDNCLEQMGRNVDDIALENLEKSAITINHPISF